MWRWKRARPPDLCREPARRSHYEAVHVKEDGRWKLRPGARGGLAGQRPPIRQLKELPWILGDWASRDQAATVRNECEWTRDKNFLKRSFAVAVEGRERDRGKAIIGWDASRQQIRSWSLTAKVVLNKPRRS